MFCVDLQAHASDPPKIIPGRREGFGVTSERPVVHVPFGSPFRSCRFDGNIQLVIFIRDDDIEELLDGTTRHLTEEIKHAFGPIHPAGLIVPHDVGEIDLQGLARFHSFHHDPVLIQDPEAGPKT